MEPHRREKALEAERGGFDDLEMGEESFVGPWPKKSHAKPTVGESVENTVRHCGCKEKQQSASESAVELSVQACAKHGNKHREQDGMAEPAMAELCGIRDAQPKRDYIQIGKH